MAGATSNENEHATIDAALDGVILENLRPASTGLALLFAIFSISHLLLLPQGSALTMALVAAGTMLIYIALGIALKRQVVPVRWAHPIAAGVCLLVLINSLLHLYLLDELKHSTNIALLVIGIGGLILSIRYLVVLLVIANALWAWLVTLLTPSPDLVHYIFLMFMATLLSILIHLGRRQAFVRLEQLHLADRRRQVELEEANRQLRENEHALELARDAAEAANRAKSAFLSNMSHELRTPLSAIIGYSDILLEVVDTRGDQEVGSDLKRIRGAGQHLQELIGEILDLAKIEAGRMTLRSDWFDVPLLVEQIAMTMRPLAAQKQNTFVVECRSDLGQMYAEPMRVRQVLINLLGNACKFTEHGTVTLRVRIEHQALEGVRTAPFEVQPGPVVVFEVSDTGIGMTPEQSAQLFTEFSQVDNALTRKYGGTGLGLALSRRLVTLMGGDITVTSELHQGSTFTVWLPVMPAFPASSDDSGSATVYDEGRSQQPEARSLMKFDNQTRS
jgi:signal transduction histidine kinase